MSDPAQFLKRLENYNLDGISQAMYNKILKGTQNGSFSMDRVRSTSSAACGLFVWINSLINYYKVA